MPDRSGWVVSISGETAGHPPLSAVPVRVPPHRLPMASSQTLDSGVPLPWDQDEEESRGSRPTPLAPGVPPGHPCLPPCLPSALQLSGPPHAREEGRSSGLTSSHQAPATKGHAGQSWVVQVCREGSPRSWESSPEANPKGLSRKRGLVGSRESSVCPQLPSLAPAGHFLRVTDK